MAEPLKYLYNRALLENLSLELRQIYPSFDQAGFISVVLDQEWDQKELKDRMSHISVSLQRFLPPSYEEAVAILTQAATKFHGFEYMC